MEQKDDSIGDRQIISRGEEMYEMVFGEPDKKPLIGLREFTIKHLFANIWSRSRPRLAGKNAITLKDRSMITVALLASQGRNEELETHLKGALHLGISKEQLLEIMIHVAHYAGWPAGNNGQRIALKVFEQKEAWTHFAEHDAS